MRRTFILLFLIFVLSLTACSQGGTVSEDEISSGHDEYSSENSDNTESDGESTEINNSKEDNSTDEDLIVLHSEITDLPYLTIPSDHNWDNLHDDVGDYIYTFITSHPDPMIDRGLDEIVFDGMPPAEYLPENFPPFPEEFEIIDCRQEKNGLYITVAVYGEYLAKFVTSIETSVSPNGYYGWICENPGDPLNWPTYYNSETGDYFYYSIIWALMEYSAPTRPYVIDFLIINN